MKIKICSLCDIGKERTNNEDVVACCSDLSVLNWDLVDRGGNYIKQGPLGAMAIVADGMGGANAGDKASSIAVESIKDYLMTNDFTHFDNSEDGVFHLFRNLVAKSNHDIMDYVIHNPDAIGLGTTIVLLWVLGDTAYFAWCGDSRCYCFNPRYGLKQLTKDHSLVQEMVDKGEISLKQAFDHRDNNVITRCIGDVDVSSEISCGSYKIEDGDIFLLCSDGLCGYCKDRQIQRILYEYYDRLEVCANQLLQCALDTGGYDNISISLLSTIPDKEMLPEVGIKTKYKRCLYRLFG